MSDLDASRTDAYLKLLGVDTVAHDLAGLTALHQAHLTALPFHNLLLLDNDGADFEPPPIEQVVDATLAGLGGTCDRLAPPFTALLRAVGFDAHLAAASVHEPGDHFVTVVHLEDRRYLCDVANGQPCWQPWDLGGGEQHLDSLGWSFTFQADHPEGPRLLRRLPDGSSKVVYRVDPERRRYEDFAGIMRAHYGQVGFGPFLSGLRGVRLATEQLWTLRDRRLVNWTPRGAFERVLAGEEALGEALVHRIGLPVGLVRRAVEVLARRRPKLVAAPCWRPGSASRDEVPDVLITVPTVGRPEALERLLLSVQDDRELFGYPGDVGVLVLDNTVDAKARASVQAVARGARRRCLPVCVVPVEEVADHLDRLHALRLAPASHARPVGIGAAREAQVALIHRHLAEPLPGLPHPARRPMTVWMLDDDLALAQEATEAGGFVQRVSCLWAAARASATLPRRAVALASYVGDPPIPGLDGLLGQLLDLRATVRHLLEVHAPGDSWIPFEAPIGGRDIYYDLAESEAEAHALPRPLPAPGGVLAVQVAASIGPAMTRLAAGGQVTRPLVWQDPGETFAATPSTRKGGNAIFLDVDALFRWPHPSWSVGQTVTRRADGLWAGLAAQDDPEALVELPIALLHGRLGQHIGGMRGSGKSTLGQLVGTSMLRMLTSSQPEVELERRRSRVREQRQRALVELDGLRRDLQRLDGWAEGLVLRQDLLASLAEASEAAITLRAALRSSLKALDAFDPEWDLSGFGDEPDLDPVRDVAALPDRVAAWRGLW